MTETLKTTVLPKDPLLAERFDVQMCNGFSLPSFAIKFLKERSSFEARDDDVYVVSYPKTGTTWLQEIVYLIHSNLNFDGAEKQGLDKRFPYIEHARTNFSFVEQMPSPRLLKTHLPYSLLPQDILDKKCKLIYITRNPKDVVVSYYHFACLIVETQYEGSFSQFFERFLLNRPTYSPFLKHTLEFWEHREDQNVLFLIYEDLQKNLPDVIRKTAEFLGKDLHEEDIHKIVEHCSFQSMAKNQKVGLQEESAVGGKANQFFRKGKVGDWKNYFSEEQNDRMEKWIESQVQGSGLQFVYEL